MQHQSDAQLLRDYAAHRSDPAFAEIVARHTDLVYSAALRQTGSPELAREIAQGVFTDLARKARALAGTLSADASLAGWLFRGTRFAGLKWLRDDHRRQTRERQFMEHFNPAAPAATDSAPDWKSVAPVLDEAMAELDDADHEAVLLRYFQNQDFHAVGRALGVSDDAAQKRVSRAVERLREYLAKRGVTTGASGLVVLISVNAVVSAPTGLAAALAVSAVAAGGVAALGLGAQFAALAGKFGLPAVVSLLLLGTVALVAWREISSHGSSPTAVTAVAGSAPPATATAPGQNTARAVGQTAVAVAIPVDTTQRDWALKLYREGEALQSNKQFDEALARFNMAAAIIENGLPPERWMVDFYFTRATMNPPAKRDPAAAIDDYTKALRIHPDYSSALANRASAYATLKQYAEANADFTRLIEDPSVDYSHYIPDRTNGMAWAYEYRGRMWLDARRPTEAIPDLQNAIALYNEPYEKVHAQFYLAASYRASQQREQLLAEANSMAEQALKWATRPGGTSDERGAAESGARWASEFLDHKASFQLEVVAAVKAKLGDFGEAEMEQKRALRELPASAEGQRGAMQARLELYRARKSLVAP